MAAGARLSGQETGSQPAQLLNGGGAQDTSGATIGIGVALAVLIGLVGLVGFSIVASTAVVWFFSTSQPPCVAATQADDGAGAAADSSVPLPAESPSARLKVSVVSWNSYYKNSLGNVLTGIRAIEAAGGDVIGLQEQNSHVKLVTLQRRLAPTWAFVGTQTKQPIAYRTGDYQLVASGVEIELRPHKMESGPGGRSVGTKYVVWAQLRDVRTRATFIVVNDHKVAGVEHSGHPRKDKPIRVRLWHEQDAAVGRLIARLEPLGVPMVKTADENLAAKADAKVRDKDFAYEQMQRRGMYSNWRVLGYPKKGTHGSRHIDYVWATTKLAAPVRQQILPRFGSDHHPVVVDLDNVKATSAETASASQEVATSRLSSRSLAPAGYTITADERAVWSALRASGFDVVHAAAAMGNMKDESGFDPQIIQGGGHSLRPADAGSGGYGLVQWTPGKKLSDYIGSATPTVQNEVTTLKAQLDGQGPHPEKAAGDAFWAAKDTIAATTVFHLRYERSASKDSSHRTTNALDIERRLRSTGASSTDRGGVSPACISSVTNDSAAVNRGGAVPPAFDRLGNPRTVEEAIAWYLRAAPAGVSGEPVKGACERYSSTLAWGYSSGYPTALAHWRAPGARTISNSPPPRGSLVFWTTSNPAGHVALSLGNGQVISTDYDSKTHSYRAGFISVGPIGDLDKWGKREGWRPPDTGRCPVPGLMEALIPREDESHGSTKEVPRGASGTSGQDGARPAARPGDPLRRFAPDR